MKYRIFILICVTFLASIILISCSPKIAKQNEERDFVIFPPPPDTTRIQFLKRIGNSQDITGGRSSFMEYIMGKEEVKSITKPYGISIRKGKIYICDTILGGLEIIDLANNTFEYFQPKGKGQLKKPINCFVDDNNYLYVADIERHQIVIFDDKGKYLQSFGDVKNSKPVDVFVTKDKIWVCDMKMKKIHIYDRKTYKLVYSIPEAEPKTSESLYSPNNIYVTNDHVFVTDFGDFKVKKYTKDGKLIKSFGSYGRNHGQFVRPKGIAVDNDENLYVIDAGFENVQIFDKDGNLLLFFGGTYEGPGNMWLPAKVIIDYDNIEYFQKYVDDSFKLKHLIFVTNQYGPDKVSVYGFVENR
jgi:DNA-binding beta-propeller fold protein YncE